jgi:hypothetical protein
VSDLCPILARPVFRGILDGEGAPRNSTPNGRGSLVRIFHLITGRKLPVLKGVRATQDRGVLNLQNELVEFGLYPFAKLDHL